MVAIFMIPVILSPFIAIALGILLYKKSKKHSSETTTLKKRLNNLSLDSLSEKRSDWFEELATANYNSEIEVEIKFIYPLLRFLGYNSGDIKFRVPVQVQVDRQEIKGVADCLVYNDSDKPFLVIEAKK